MIPHHKGGNTMKTLAYLILPLFFIASVHAEEGPKTEEQKVLYALGGVLGRNIAIFNLKPAELKYVTQGLRDSVEGKKPQVDLETYGPRVNSLAEARQAVKADAEKKKAGAFMEKAAQEPGAVKTASGLIFIPDPKQTGKGASPKSTDQVKVHYHGTLTDGTVFDSSVKRDQPATFPLNGVIPCWTEGVQRMKVGGKAKLICPSSIAYGDQGRPPQIPGGATLVFEVELLDIVK
ncbi:MAG: FKBP-type peptidyl-prolyl cis-trans isomerase [Elusimicrobia bacterium]|nr:FKBP-type peptidyl-prolyl cis-trans isomerase [Elusimicrobiota bacterium]